MTKKETLKRQKEIKIRLTDEEHQKLLDRCTAESLASWIRETCLGKKPTKQSKILEVDPKLLRQLSGIGNNLNQIARLINQQSKSNSVIDRIAVITALSGIEKELKRLHIDHKNT
ncbi:plasmid mobilization protein [Acinetobacter pollinis]|uniref:plasmid mobilization protein n=1 Tax=Acinetobacter pollinis TaxID=2605270 RepID=UPI0018A2633B|nr:plasmid mobilization relaxosome protein MobC [Acinetobacter pollinis]MBF7691738.1 MobC family plasmid mobilization relaxosome protein [Acinetobacter pollinis]MBF7699356.1 MobC family plasmid mobilization relaxosome protein [Acinetobacter pollinis]